VYPKEKDVRNEAIRPINNTKCLKIFQTNVFISCRKYLNPVEEKENNANKTNNHRFVKSM
jgi:hypothetical protein